MAARRTTPNRFSDTATDTSTVLSGIQQDLDPRYNKSFVVRNLAPYPTLPQNPKKYRKLSDAKLRRMATRAVLKERNIKPRPIRKPAKPRKKK